MADHLQRRSDVDTSEGPPVRWWHYTLGTTLLEIIAAGRIMRVASGSRKAIWFTSRDSWEPTATKGIVDSTDARGRRDATLDEMIKKGGALIRIEVPPDIARHSWEEHRRRYEDPRIADALESSAQARGSDPTTWRVSYHDVPLARILSVEALVEGEWCEVGRPRGNGIALNAHLAERIKAARNGAALRAQRTWRLIVGRPTCQSNANCEEGSTTSRTGAGGLLADRARLGRRPEVITSDTHR